MDRARDARRLGAPRLRVQRVALSICDRSDGGVVAKVPQGHGVPNTDALLGCATVADGEVYVTAVWGRVELLGAVAVLACFAAHAHAGCHNKQLNRLGRTQP
jgi:hypothetical protein